MDFVDEVKNQVCFLMPTGRKCFAFSKISCSQQKLFPVKLSLLNLWQTEYKLRACMSLPLQVMWCGDEVLGFSQE